MGQGTTSIFSYIKGEFLMNMNDDKLFGDNLDLIFAEESESALKSKIDNKWKIFYC